MEHDDDDVLILDDEVTIEFERAPSTEDLFRRIDEVLTEETDVPRSRHVAVPLSGPAVACSRPKRAFEPVRAPERGVPTIVLGTVRSTESPAVAGPSGLSDLFQNRLGPAVPSLASRLGPVASGSPVEETKAKRPRGPDKRPEQYRALTQQGLATLRLPELIRPAVNRPFYVASRYNRNELLWRELNHKDRTAREYSEWNLHLQTPRQMPKISFETSKRLIADTFGLDRTTG